MKPMSNRQGLPFFINSKRHGTQSIAESMPFNVNRLGGKMVTVNETSIIGRNWSSEQKWRISYEKEHLWLNDFGSNGNGIVRNER